MVSKFHYITKYYIYLDYLHELVNSTLTKKQRLIEQEVHFNLNVQITNPEVDQSLYE